MKNFAKIYHFDILDVLAAKKHNKEDETFQIGLRVVWPDITSEVELSLGYDEEAKMHEQFELLTQEQVLNCLHGVFKMMDLKPRMVKTPPKTEVQKEFLFLFNNYQEWVDKAQQFFEPYQNPETKTITADTRIICLDMNGNCLTTGKDFRIADERGNYPVKAYRLIRVSDIDNTETTES